MADFSWTPPIAILATGTLFGAIVVAVRSRSRAGQAAGSEASPAEGTRADLRRQYDALIRRLAEGVAPEERATIEVEAAMILREMETGISPRPSSTANRAVSALATAGPALTPRPTPAWLGFLYGVATMGVLGGLVYFASSGAAERKGGASPTGGATMGSGAGAADRGCTRARCRHRRGLACPCRNPRPIRRARCRSCRRR